jgi:O-antigen/teichoic acid export membrane protein
LTEALRFGAPLLPHILLFQALNQADRFVLAGTVSDAEIGRYAIAQQAMWIFAVVLMEFTRAIMPSYARHSIGVRANALRHLVGQQLTMAPAVATAAVIAAPVAVGVLLPNSYAADLYLYPWLAIAVACVGLYSIPTNLLVLVAGRSQQVWVGTSLAVGVNLTLVWALAPALGVLAAAMASALGYMTLTAVMSIVELRREALLRRCFPKRRGLLAPAGAALCLALAMLSLTLATPLRLAVGIAAVAMAGAFVIDARRQARFVPSTQLPTQP